MSRKKFAITGLLVGLGAGIAGAIGYKRLKRSIKLQKVKGLIKDIKKKKHGKGKQTHKKKT